MITKYREGTELLWFPLTEIRGDVGAIQSVHLFFATSPTARPGAEDWEDATLVLPTDTPLGDGLTVPHIAVLEGPEGDIDLTPQTTEPVDHQVWWGIRTATEFIVRKHGLVTVQ